MTSGDGSIQAYFDPLPYHQNVNNNHFPNLRNCALLISFAIVYLMQCTPTELKFERKNERKSVLIGKSMEFQFWIATFIFLVIKVILISLSVIVFLRFTSPFQFEVQDLGKIALFQYY